MAVLSESNQRELKERFERDLVGNVKVNLFTQRDSLIVIPGRECPTCKETGELLQEVAALSDKLELEVHDVYAQPDDAAELGIERIPAIVLEGDARGEVRYFGIPAGSGFPVLVEDLVDVSKGTTSLSDESRQTLGALSKEVHIQVFVTPT
jgi:thiol-disulfide isomerase/thioredoxin